MRWIGTGHQVPRASTTRAGAHGASGLIARSAATDSAKAATAWSTSASVVVARSVNSTAEWVHGGSRPIASSTGAALPPWAVQAEPGETATPRAASASARVSPSTQPAETWTWPGMRAVAGAVQAHVRHRQQARR